MALGREASGGDAAITSRATGTVVAHTCRRRRAFSIHRHQSSHISMMRKREREKMMPSYATDVKWEFKQKPS